MLLSQRHANPRPTRLSVPASAATHSTDLWSRVLQANVDPPTLAELRPFSSSERAASARARADNGTLSGRQLDQAAKSSLSRYLAAADDDDDGDVDEGRSHSTSAAPAFDQLLSSALERDSNSTTAGDDDSALADEPDDAAVPLPPRRSQAALTASSDFGVVLPLIDQMVDSHDAPSGEQRSAWLTTRRALSRTPSSITIGAAKVRPPLPPKSDEARDAISAPTPSAAPAAAMPQPAQTMLSSLKQKLHRASVGLTLSAHPTLRRLRRAGDEPSGDAARRNKPVRAVFRLPLLERYRERLRAALVGAAMQLSDAESLLERAAQDDAMLSDVLARFSPKPMLAAHAARLAADPVAAGAVRVAVSTLQLSAVALIPSWAWALDDEEREATLRAAPCALLARLAQRLVRCHLLSQRASQHVCSLRLMLLRRKLSAVDARIERIRAAERGERLPVCDDADVAAALTDAFFESPQQLEARDDPMLDAVGSDKLLRSEAAVARDAFADRCQHLHRVSDKQRQAAVASAIASFVARDAAPADAGVADELDAVLRDLRTPQGRQLERLCHLVSMDDGDGGVVARDVVAFLEQFVSAAASRYAVPPEHAAPFATLAARCVFPMIAHDAGELLKLSPSAPSSDASAAFAAGCARWRERTGEALGLSPRLWTGLEQRQEAMVAAGVVAAAAERPCVLPDALAVLQSLELVVAASDVLRILQLTVAAICGRASVALGGEAVGADALFPLVMHVIAHANLHSMPHALAAACEFGSDALLSGEQGYCLTTFQAAVAHIAASDSEV